MWSFHLEEWKKNFFPGLILQSLEINWDELFITFWIRERRPLWQWVISLFFSHFLSSRIFLYFYKLFYDLGFPYPEIDNSRGVRFLQYFTIFYNFPWMNFQVNKISQIYDFFCDFTKLIHANVFSEYCSGCLTVTVLLSYGN